MNNINYAMDNGKNYFMCFENGVMSIKDIIETGARFTSRAEWIVNGKLCHTTLRDCIESLHGYLKPIMYKGENINVWQEDLFISYNPNIGEYYRDYHFDDTVLKKYEYIF